MATGGIVKTDKPFLLSESDCHIHRGDDAIELIIPPDKSAPDLSIEEIVKSINKAIEEGNTNICNK